MKGSIENKKRLSVENRMLIEQLLRLNYKLKDVAHYADSTSSTVSRKIKNRRITGKGEFKECKKTNRHPLFVMDVQIKYIAWKNIITIILKLKIIMNIY